jgi:hypothetical protein
MTFTSTSRPPQGPTRTNPRLWTTLLVLLIIVSLFMCAFVAIFMNPILDKAKNMPTARLAGETFSNPYGSAITHNSGGWALRFTSVGGPRLDLKDLVVALKTQSSGGKPSHVWMLQVKGAGNHSADLSYEGSTTHWYLRAYNTNMPLHYANGTAPVGLNSTTASNLREDQLSTLEGAVVLYRDIDLDGNLSLQDKLTVYKDVNSDGEVDLTAGTLLELQTKDGKLVSSAILK